MKHKLLYLLLLFTVPVFAQKVEDAQVHFNNGEYKEAREIYAALLKKNSKDPLNNYRHARCSFEMQDYNSAIIYFLKTKKDYLQRDYYLAESYYFTYQFDKAVEFYKIYLPKLKGKEWEIKEIEQKINQAELAERLLARVEDVAIIDSVIVDKQNFLNFYKCSSELGKLKQERIALDSTRTEDKITYLTQREDRRYSSDLNDGQMDIFTSYRLLDQWTEPAPLPHNINTEANENYPFLLLDGVTLYFASDGDNSIGGYDIFITKYVPASNMYLTPENVGMPFNSPWNDYMMVIDEASEIGWFATDRYQPEGKVAIYTFVPNSSKVILRSEDKNYLREAAQLKTYRQAERKERTSTTATNKKAEDAHEFEFIVNDKLIYTKTSHFKSPEAKIAFGELQQLIAQSKNMEEQLNALREKYNTAKLESERATIAPKILLLEDNMRKQENLIEEKTTQVRNEEIKFLTKK